MNRRGVAVVAVVIGAVAVFWMVRDPIGAADVVRQGWSMLTQAVGAVITGLGTFVRHLFRG